MTIRFELPLDIEANLRQQVDDLDETIKEVALVELYRQERLTQHELALAMGISRLDTEALLKKHAVTEDLQTFAEYEAALTNLRELTAE